MQTSSEARQQVAWRTNKTGGGGSSSFRDILSSLAESLKPGGEIDKTLMADIDVQGKQLQSQLSAGAIGRGLGNAQVGIPTQVFKNVSQAKAKARSGLLEQYLGILTNLAQMAFQEEQANAERSVQASAGQTPGLDVFGKPLSGSLISRQLASAERQIQPATREQPTRDSLASLYAAGGMGQASAASQVAPSLFNVTSTTGGGGEDFGNLLELNPGLRSFI